MAPSRSPATLAADRHPSSEARVCDASPELDAELRAAVDDLERGKYFELTPAQLKEWAANGSLPELDEWLALPD